jgi:hypothetical protein
MADTKLAVNVFDKESTSEQESPQTPTGNATAPDDTIPTSQTPAQNETSSVQDTNQTAPEKETSGNLLVNGSLFIGFLILVLMMLIIIQKQNKKTK